MTKVFGLGIKGLSIDGKKPLKSFDTYHAMGKRALCCGRTWRM